MTNYIQASSVEVLLHVGIEGQINLTAIQDQECSRPLSCLAVPMLWLHASERGVSGDGRRWQERTGSGEREGSAFSCVDGWSRQSPAWWQRSCVREPRTFTARRSPVSRRGKS